jgi:hypothetical protein
MVLAVTAPMFAASVNIFFIPCVRIERLALDDADRSEQAHRCWIRPLARFFLNNLVQKGPERVVTGCYEVGRYTGTIHKPHGWRVGRI